MLKEKQRLIESQADLIVGRLLSAGLIEDDDDVTTKVYNVVQQTLEE